MPKKITKLEDLRPLRRNPNQGTLRGSVQLHESITRTGLARPIVVDANGEILAGNHVVEEAGQIFGPDLPVRVVQTTGTELIVHQRVDVTAQSVAGRQIAIADNRVAQVGISLDPVIVLQDFKAGVEVAPYWTENELVGMAEDVLSSNAEPGDIGLNLPLWPEFSLRLPPALLSRLKALLQEFPGEPHEQMELMVQAAENVLTTSSPQRALPVAE